MIEFTELPVIYTGTPGKSLDMTVGGVYYVRKVKNGKYLFENDSFESVFEDKKYFKRQYWLFHGWEDLKHLDRSMNSAIFIYPDKSVSLHALIPILICFGIGLILLFTLGA